MMASDALIVQLPLNAADNPHAWVAANDELQWSGRLSALLAEIDADLRSSLPVTVIVPAGATRFSRRELRGFEPRQELAIARISAKEDSLTDVAAATAFDAQGKIQIASVDRQILQSGLKQLADVAMYPLKVIPANALLSPPDNELWRMKLGDESFVASAAISFVDDPALINAFFADLPILDFSDSDTKLLLTRVTKADMPNFLNDIEIRHSAEPLLTDANRRWTKRLFFLALTLFIAGVIGHWANLEWQTSKENRAALAAAKTVDPAIQSSEQAEVQVYAALARKGIMRASASNLIAIVWQSVKVNENVALTSLSLSSAGLLSATVSAPDPTSVNGVLVAIQQSGYKITATPRRDQSGATLVDLTVRAP